jgi:hypothetical protein
MGDFRIWGRVEHVGPHQFFVIVSAVPNAPALENSRTEVERAMAASRHEADQIRNDIMRRMGGTITARGDCVVDVEEN